jgi:DNA polymerase-3 subunit gamma/tau
MSEALYRKWRPKDWAEVVGQGHVISTLRNALAAGKIAHAYLFAGPRGTGKTTTARLLARAVNCTAEATAKRPCGKCQPCRDALSGRFMDMIEIDAASNTSVEDVRDLRDKINFAPNTGRYKVYIIDEVHMLSTAAFNALLKTLEEPPPHAIFILATTEVHKIPATVLSRCQRHEFRRIPVKEIVAQLQKLAKSENIRAEPEALTLLARQSTGAMRDAISLLDQLASTGEVVTLALAQQVLGAAASQAVIDLVQALIDRNAADGFDRLHAALDGGSDPRQFARQMVDYLRDLLMQKTGNSAMIDATPETKAVIARQAQAFSQPELLRVIRLFNTAAGEGRSAWQPALPLEMALVEALNPPAEAPAAAPAAPVVVRSAPAQPIPPGSPTAPPPLPPAASTPAAPESEGDADLNRRLNANWKAILARVKANSRQTEGVLNSVVVHQVRSGALFLGFASDIVKYKIEKDENLKIVQEAVESVLGQEIIIRCVTVSGKGGQLPPQVENDGMVAAAVNELGGEIVDVQ